MDSIRVTFPTYIPITGVIALMQEAMKRYSKYTIEVEFDKEEDGENVYWISTDDGPPAFYQAGMTTSIILAQYQSKGYTKKRKK